MHKLLTDAPGKKLLLLGNEAIARGALEAGIGCASTYPGTPSSELSLALFEVSRETDLYFEYSVNEKVAMEMAASSANCGVRSMAIMKHVGVNVAADALMTLAYVGVKAGMVVMTADDPFMFSSQNEQDNRYYAKMAKLPMLEPSTLEEAREMTRAAFDLSEELGEPVILRTTTRINHSTAAVSLGEIKQPETKGDFTKNPFWFVTVPAVSRKLHTRLLERWKKAEALAEKSSYNRVSGAGEFGVITSGVSACYVNDAVADLSARDRVSILRLGFTNPPPKKAIAAFLAGKKKILVVEEGEPFLEETVKVAAQEAGIEISIAGKGEGLFSREGELDPAQVRRVLASRFGLPDLAVQKIDLKNVPEIPARPPNLCAGCPHRATFYEIYRALGDREAVFPTDIGCYTLGLLPPLSSADFLLCMGSSVGTAGGFAQFTDKKVVAFIGDSTFFHAGIPGIVNALFNNHDFTLVILDNATTAMTGHQPHPGVDMEALGHPGYNRVHIEDVIRGLGVKKIVVTDPYKVRKSIEAMKEAIDYKGLSVIISRRECPLFSRMLKRKSGHPFVVTDKCQNHRVCVDRLACPAMFVENGRVRINGTMCTGCAVCAQVCPENAILPLKEEPVAKTVAEPEKDAF
ncbi:MAG: indolepyruvate ferredoxin oxidoreductase subunit alpha [Thermodesulfobacteriota bacterium]